MTILPVGAITLQVTPRSPFHMQLLMGCCPLAMLLCCRLCCTRRPCAWGLCCLSRVHSACWGAGWTAWPMPGRHSARLEGRRTGRAWQQQQRRRLRQQWGQQRLVRGLSSGSCLVLLPHQGLLMTEQLHHASGSLYLAGMASSSRGSSNSNNEQLPRRLTWVSSSSSSSRRMTQLASAVWTLRPSRWLMQQQNSSSLPLRPGCWTSWSAARQPLTAGGAGGGGAGAAGAGADAGGAGATGVTVTMMMVGAGGR